MVEIEMRFKTEEGTEKALQESGAEFIEETEQKDTYLKFGKDEERRVVIRFRDKQGKKFLTYKGSSVLEQDTAWQEWEEEIKDPESLQKLMLSNGFVEVVKINKKRKTYKLDGFEINIDDVENLGNFVEVEIHAEDAEHGKEKIINFVTQTLKIPEENIVQKGYVKLMLNE